MGGVFSGRLLPNLLVVTQRSSLCLLFWGCFFGLSPNFPWVVERHNFSVGFPPVPGGGRGVCLGGGRGGVKCGRVDVPQLAR